VFVIKIQLANTAEANVADKVHHMYYINDGVHGSFGVLPYKYRVMVPSLLDVGTSSILFPTLIFQKLT